MTGVAILSDVDMTLAESTSNYVSPENKRLAFDLHGKLKGAFAVVTGRAGDSVDLTFPGMPASVEHHASWRPEIGTDYIALAPLINTRELGAIARQSIQGQVRIFDEISKVLGTEPGVYIQEKKHALALIFAAAAATPEIRDLLADVATRIVAHGGLAATHRIAKGSDAVEIVPQGFNKGDAVRHFMGTLAFARRIPIFLGDSSSDATAMKVCADEFGGFGIAIGSGIPDAPYVHVRVKSINEAWQCMRVIESQPDDFAAVKEALRDPSTWGSKVGTMPANANLARLQVA